MKQVTIPNDRSPFTIRVNGTEYSYRAGETQYVPDDVAAAIANYKDAQPKKTPEAQEPAVLEVNGAAEEDDKGEKTLTLNVTAETLRNALRAGKRIKINITDGGSNYVCWPWLDAVETVEAETEKYSFCALLRDGPYWATALAGSDTAVLTSMGDWDSDDKQQEPAQEEET